MSNNLKEIVAEIQYKLNLSQEQIAERIGYSRPYLTNAIKNNTGGKIKDKIQREFKEILQIVPRETKKADIKQKVVNSDQVSSTSAALMEIAKANKLLAESIMVAAQSQLIDAESRKALVGNNTDLTKALKDVLKATADSELNIQSNEPAISGALLELLAELSVTGKIYRSKQEAVAALGMKLLPGSVKKGKERSVAGVGR